VGLLTVGDLVRAVTGGDFARMADTGGDFARAAAEAVGVADEAVEEDDTRRVMVAGVGGFVVVERPSVPLEDGTRAWPTGVGVGAETRGLTGGGPMAPSIPRGRAAAAVDVAVDELTRTLRPSVETRGLIDALEVES